MLLACVSFLRFICFSLVWGVLLTPFGVGAFGVRVSFELGLSLLCVCVWLFCRFNIKRSVESVESFEHLIYSLFDRAK